MDLSRIFLKDACPTSIGGQAVLEGVMMRGADRTAVTLRLPDGRMYLKTMKNRAGYTYKIWKCRGREEGLCTASIWKEDVLIDEIGGKLGITCAEAGIADMGTILIGDEIEWTT